MVIGNNSISLFILLIYYIYNIFGLERINVSLSVIYCFVDIRLIKSSIIISYIVNRYNNTFIYIYCQAAGIYYLSRAVIKLFTIFQIFNLKILLNLIRQSNINYIGHSLQHIHHNRNTRIKLRT